jgi:hypothetical protein
MTIRSRTLAVLALAAAALGASVGIGAPAGAGTAPVCETEDPATLYVCRSYDALARRWATTAEVEYWAPKMPASKTVFTSTLARSAEVRDETVFAYYQTFSTGSPSPEDLDYWMPQVTQPKGLRKLEAALLARRGGITAEWVAMVYATYLDREPSVGEVAYWTVEVETKGRNIVAGHIVQSAEARDLRVYWTYANELGIEVDGASLGYWSERLRTGLSWLDLRIALRSSADGYPDAEGGCASPAPIVEYRCK